MIFNKKRPSIEIIPLWAKGTIVSMLIDFTVYLPFLYFRHIKAWPLETEFSTPYPRFNMIQYKRTYEVILNDETPSSNITQIMAIDSDEDITKREFDAGADIVNDPERGGYVLLQVYI